MTFIGKILIFINLVFSLLFVAFAGAVYSSHTNWQTAHTSAKADLKLEKEDHGTTQKDFREYKTTTTDQIAALDNKSKKRLADHTREKGRADNLQQQLNDLKSAHDTQRTVATLEKDESSFRRDEALEQRQVNKSLHENQVLMVRKNRSLEDIIFDLQLQLGDYEEKHLVLLDEYKTVKLISRRKGGGLGTRPSADIEPPPPIAGKVATPPRYGIGNRLLYVEITLGSDDGIKEGQMLTVFRPGNGKKIRTKYLGRLRIISVFPDKAVGTVQEKAKNGVIAKGDNVTSKL